MLVKIYKSLILIFEFVFLMTTNKEAIVKCLCLTKIYIILSLYKYVSEIKILAIISKIMALILRFRKYFCLNGCSILRHLNKLK